MSKRNVDEVDEDISDPKRRKQVTFDENVKKHTLDSDEEDDDEGEKYNVLDENDIEGEEDGPIERPDGGAQRMTAFNMTEEMELGHFDKDGHFIWKNEKEVRDNWLDNVDWQNVSAAKKPTGDAAQQVAGIADEESDDDDTPPPHFDHIVSYRQIMAFLRPGESINKALKRLGGADAKLSSIERLRRKKAGTLGQNQDVTTLTELANGVLTNLGNMDVYQETYEQITQKLAEHDKKNKSSAKIVEAELDMYADDFDDREKSKLVTSTDAEMPLVEDGGGGGGVAGDSGGGKSAEVMWEFKWDQTKDAVEGPFDSTQMSKWADEGHFKTGVWVRKCGAADSNFYSSNRIDFELYL